jgi:hypothetical protein
MSAVVWSFLVVLGLGTLLAMTMAARSAATSAVCGTAFARGA